jgi:hypothetical protein
VVMGIGGIAARNPASIAARRQGVPLLNSNT